MENTLFTSRVDILNRERTITNKTLLIVYIIFFILWILSLTCAFVAGDYTHLVHGRFVDKIKELLDVSRFFVIIGYSLLAAFYAIILFVIMRWTWISNFSYIILATFWIPFVTSIVVAVFNLNAANVWSMLASFCSCTLIFYLFNAEWFYLPEKIFKESCKVIMFFPSTILFSIMCNIVCLLVTIVVVLATIILYPSISTFVTLLIIIIIGVGLWTILIIFNLGQMVLCGTYATWFWTTNKDEIPSSIALRYLLLCSRYHLGTVVYGTSIIGLAVTIYLLLSRALRKFMDGFDATFICFFLYNFFDMVAMRFAIFGAIVRCVTAGKNYQESTSDALNFLEEHPKRCLLVTKVMEYCLMFAAGALFFLMALSVYGYVGELAHLERYEKTLVAIGCGTLVFAGPLLATLDAAYSTLLFCVLEDLGVHDGSAQRPYMMSAELHSAVHHEGPPSWYRSCRSCCGNIAEEEEPRLYAPLQS